MSYSFTQFSTLAKIYTITAREPSIYYVPHCSFRPENWLKPIFILQTFPGPSRHAGNRATQPDYWSPPPEHSDYRPEEMVSTVKGQTKQSKRIPYWLWIIIAKSLGIRLNSRDKPILAWILHLMTVVSAGGMFIVIKDTVGIRTLG